MEEKELECCKMLLELYDNEIEAYKITINKFKKFIELNKNCKYLDYCAEDTLSALSYDLDALYAMKANIEEVLLEK